MKNLSQNKKEENSPLEPMAQTAHLKRQKNRAFSIPAGSKLNDLYMDAQQVAIELNISKRTIRNMRKSSTLSFTKLCSKIFYFRQEIADILEANKISQKDNIPLRKIEESLSKNKKK